MTRAGLATSQMGRATSQVERATTRFRRVPVSPLMPVLVAACAYPVLTALETAAGWKPLDTHVLVSGLLGCSLVAWVVALFPLPSSLSVIAGSLGLAVARLRWPEVQLFLVRYVAPGWRAAWALWRSAPAGLRPDEALWARALVVLLVALPLSWSVQRSVGPFWVVSACALWLLYLWFNYLDATVNWLVMLFAVFVPLFALWRRSIVSARGDRQGGPVGGAATTAVLAATMGVMALTSALALPKDVPPFQVDALARQIEHVFPVVAEWRGGGAGSRYTLGEAGFGASVKDLGGPVRRNTDKVAEVEVVPDTGGRLYLRSEVWATYTGRGWENKHRRVKISSLGVVDLAEMLPKELTWAYPRRDATNVTVLTVRPSLDQNSLFVLTEPFEVRQPARDVWGDAGGSLWIYSRSRETYSVLSVVTQRPDLFSRRSVIRWPQARALQAVPWEYLHLPESIPERVREEALRVVRGAAGPWEAATRLERYVRQYSYVEDAPRAPRGRDFVEYFLFDLREGYCAYHSTALAIMCRIAGVPSRWVTGYLAPAGTGVRTVLQENAHAWVEVYIPGSGWVTLEGTPAYDLPEREIQPVVVSPGDTPPGEVAPGGRPPELGFEETEQGPSAGAGASPRGYRPAAVVAGAVIVALLGRAGWSGFVWRRRRRRSATASSLFDSCLALLSAVGLGKAPEETAREYLARLKTRAPEAGTVLSRLGPLFEEEYYGGSRLVVEEGEKQELWSGLVQALKGTVGRVRYLLGVYLVPSYRAGRR